MNLNSTRPSCIPILRLLAGALAALLVAACAHAPEAPATAQAPLVFPPPPRPARVQYLGAVSSSKDLPTQRSSFADFVMGEEPVQYPLAKPISAAMHGSKVYICDTVFNRVFVYDLATGKTGLLTGDSGSGKISQPNNLDIDRDGNVYVADKLRQAVLVFGPGGQFLHAWGRPGEVSPVDVKVGAKYLYVAIMDKDHNQVELWDRQTGALVKTIGTTGTKPGEFIWPTNLALGPEGHLFVSDTGNFRVQEFTAEGDLVGTFGQAGTNYGDFAFPKGIDVDGKGRIYVADSRFCNVQIFNKAHKLLLFFGGPGRSQGNLDLPAGLRVYPWPQGIPWLSEKLAPGFQPEYLVIVVSQKGDGFINFYAVAQTPEGE